MKNKILLLILAGSLVLPAFRFISNTLTDVGTTIDEVKKQTIAQLSQKDFSAYYTTEIKTACQKLPVGVREATIMSVGKIIRDYVESPQFQTDYTNYLNETYPQAPYSPSDTDWKQARIEKENELKASLSNPQVLDMMGTMVDADIQGKQSMLNMFSDPNMKTVIVNNPAFSEEAMKKDVADDKVLKDLFAKDKKAFGVKYVQVMSERDIRDRQNQEKGEAISRNQQAQEEITKRKDYKANLKTQLQQFLDASSDIDFNAALKTNENGMKVFVNPDYESKGSDWKFYFRCGREAITGARKYAQTWLTSLK